MSMRDFLGYLKTQHVEFVRSCGGHDIYRRGSKVTPVPRHKVIAPGTKRDICKRLDIPNIK